MFPDGELSLIRLQIRSLPLPHCLRTDFLGLVPGWMVWIIVFRDFLITLLRSYTEYIGKPVETSKFAKAKTFLQFAVIYYILILYVARSTPFLALQYGGIIEFLLNYSLVYGIMFLTTALTVWTGTVYCRDNWNIIRGFYGSQNKTTKSDTKSIVIIRSLRSYVFLLPDFFPVIHRSLPALSAVRPHLFSMRSRGSNIRSSCAQLSY